MRTPATRGDMRRRREETQRVGVAERAPFFQRWLDSGGVDPHRVALAGSFSSLILTACTLHRRNLGTEPIRFAFLSIRADDRKLSGGRRDVHAKDEEFETKEEAWSEAVFSKVFYIFYTCAFLTDQFMCGAGCVLFFAGNGSTPRQRRTHPSGQAVRRTAEWQATWRRRGGCQYKIARGGLPEAG